MRKLILSVSLITLLILGASQENAHSQTAPANSKLQVNLPMKKDSVRFAVIGDTGTGSREQQELGNLFEQYHTAFPFEFVLMMGDNLYGGEAPQDYDKKFEVIYKKLLDEKVKFYATLGNHDTSNERFYDHFNMNGKE